MSALVMTEPVLPKVAPGTARSRHRSGAVHSVIRYLPKGTASRARQVTSRGHSAFAISTDVLAQKIERFSVDRLAKSNATRDLEEVGFDPRPDVQAWFKPDASFDEWATDAARSGVDHGQDEWPADEVATVDRLPSAWLYTAYVLARVHQTIGLGQRLKKSDRDDGEHCAGGAYFDILVTDDVPFRETFATMPDLPFAPMSLVDFAQWLNGHSC